MASRIRVYEFDYYSNYYHLQATIVTCDGANSVVFLLIVILTVFAVVLVLVVIIYTWCLHRSPAYASGLDAHDDVRENIIHYDEEGVGKCSCLLFVILCIASYFVLILNNGRAI